ncbi:MAG TPA: 2OG-Fe(II) oxygenase [Byssovorax sp.]|jgi:hypothetical protein
MVPGRCVDPADWDTVALAAAYASAAPFPHVVVDSFARKARLRELVDAFDDEPAEELHDEIFSFMASSKDLASAALRGYAADLERPDVLDAIGAITGSRVTRAEVRAYVYLPGHYLLPHADHDAAERGRAIALAHYVDARDLEGGELELFACDLEDGEVVRARPSTRVAPRANRALLFEVSPRSLHQVREVTRGARLSLAGWFFP